MFKNARIPSVGLLLAAAVMSGCGDSSTAPSALETSGSIAARSASVGVLAGTWAGTIGADLATLVLSQAGSRVTGRLDVTTATGTTIPYSVEGLENKGNVYLNLFDGVSLPQPIVGTVSDGSLTGKLNATVDVKFKKK